VDERTVLKFRRLIREGKIKSSRETEVPIWLGLADEPGYSARASSTSPTTHRRGHRHAAGARLFQNEDRVLSRGCFVRVRCRSAWPTRR